MKKINFYIAILFFPVIAFSQGSTPDLFYNNGDNVYIQSGAILHVQGDVVNAGAGTLTNNGLLNIEGDLTNNGTLTTDAHVGEGTVRLIGNSTMAGSAAAGVQTLSGTLSSPGTASFYNLVIDGGAAGQVMALGANALVTGSLVWNGSSTLANTYNPSNFPNTLGNSSIMQVRGSVPTGNGIIQSSGQVLYIPSSVTTSIAGYGPTSYVSGYLQRGVAPDYSYDLPVGSSSNYELANIKFNGSMAGTTSLTANFNTPAPTQPDPATCIINGQPINSLLNAGYWTIHPDNQPTAGTYTVTLNMTGYSNEPSAGTNAQGGSVTPGQQIGIVKRTNSSSPWLGCGMRVYGNSSTDQGTGECTGNGSFANNVAFAERIGVPSFSDFGIGLEEYNSATLPVDLIELSAVPIDNSYIRVNWATASEQDNKGFEVMRSEDGANFTNIGWVNGNGTSNVQNNYTYDDKTAQPNVVYYYKLDQVNTDGIGIQTNIVTAQITAGPGITVSELIPNPTSGKTRLVINSTTGSQSASVRFYDILGKLMIGSNNQITAGTNVLDFDMSSFADGTYTSIISIGNTIYSKKVVLVK